MKLSDIEKQIESLVSQRETSKATKAIKHYLLKNRKFTKSRIKAAHWYRRLGLRTLALSVLKAERETNIDLSMPSGEEQLNLCYILNSLGSTRYALRMLDKMKTANIPNRLLPLIGGIWLSDNFYERALAAFQKAHNTHENPGSDTYHLTHISVADALVGLKKFDQAIAIVEEIRLKRNVDLIHFIATSALGEYLVKAGQPEKAFEVLSSAKNFLKEEDCSNDAGFWWKWFGVASFLNGHFEEGYKALDKAFEILYKPQNKPEGWLEVLYWIGQAKKIQNSSEYPNEWLKIAIMPTVEFSYTPDILSHFQGKVFRVCQSGVEIGDYSKFISEKYDDKILMIDEISDCELYAGKTTLGLNLTLKLVSLLFRSHEKTLSRNRLIESLWPDDLYSFYSLNTRLNNLINETRSRGFKIKIEDGYLQLENSRSSIAILYRPEGTIPGLDFLLRHKEVIFKRATIEAYYSMSRSQATRLITSWLNQELIVQGQRYQYAVTDKLNQLSLSS